MKKNLHNSSSFFKYAKSLPVWASWIGLLLAIFATAYIMISDNKSAQSYDSTLDSPEKLLQGISCPIIMAQGKPELISAFIKHYVPDKKINVSVTINANDFSVFKDSDTTFDELPEQGFWWPGWIVVPNKSGKLIITISASASNFSLSNSHTCEVIVINTFGLNLKYVDIIAITSVFLGIYVASPIFLTPLGKVVSQKNAG